MDSVAHVLELLAFLWMLRSRLRSLRRSSWIACTRVVDHILGAVNLESLRDLYIHNETCPSIAYF